MNNIIALIPIGSGWSVLSIVGIPLFIIMLTICIGRFWGWIAVLNFFFFGMLVVGIWRVNPVYTKSDLEEESSSMAPRYYKIHCIDGVPAWVWHPDALWAAPGLALLVSLCLSPFLMITTAASRSRQAAKQAVYEVTNY